MQKHNVLAQISDETALNGSAFIKPLYSYKSVNLLQFSYINRDHAIFNK